ncbi:MAG: MgtC/SapB family protein [archaeon]
MENNVILFRFFLATFLVFLYGLQRQRSKKPVGFGTFILVAIGSCGLAVTSLTVASDNPLTLLSAIVTGIGFLGAGALFRNSDKIFGFTTAASIWVFAIFGLMVGLGEYFSGLLIYLIIWFVVIFDNFLEKKGMGSYRRKIVIVTGSFVAKGEVATVLSSYCTRFNLIELSTDKKKKTFSYSYFIEGLTKEIEALLKEFNRKDWCTSVVLTN